MNTIPFLLLAALAAAPGPSAKPQQEQPPGTTELDSGMLFVYDHGTPVAHESFVYGAAGDSLLLLATHERKLRGQDGTPRNLVKTLQMVVDGFDFGLRNYISRVEFDGHSTVRGVLPAVQGDTTMTIFQEDDDAGSADQITQPPGRVFVMDPMMFTLFDVVCRNIAGRTFTTRPIELVTLSPKPVCSEARVTDAGPDTVRWGGRQVVTHRYVMADSSSTFTMWATDKGEMLRLENTAAELVVMREPPAAKAPAAKAPGRARRTPAPARKPAAR